MDARDLTAAPLNPLPPAVWLVLAGVAGVEGVLALASAGWLGGPGGIAWRITAIERLGFAAELQAWMIDTGRAPLRHLWRYVTYSWVQGGTLAAVLALAMLAGLGKAVAEGAGTRIFVLIVALVPPATAAVFAGLVAGDPRAWLIGAFPLIFGLVGAYTHLLWCRAGADSARRRRAFGLIGALLLARLAFGLLAKGGPAWIADLVAFGLGWALAWVAAPGALARLRARG